MSSSQIPDIPISVVEGICQTDPLEFLLADGGSVHLVKGAAGVLSFIPHRGVGTGERSPDLRRCIRIKGVHSDC
jgi:hypothetical protein